MSARSSGRSPVCPGEDLGKSAPIGHSSAEVLRRWDLLSWDHPKQKSIQSSIPKEQKGCLDSEHSTINNHFTMTSLADLRKLKVAELKEELAKRDLDTKGVKEELVQRLLEATSGETANANGDEKSDPAQQPSEMGEGGTAAQLTEERQPAPVRSSGAGGVGKPRHSVKDRHDHAALLNDGH